LFYIPVAITEDCLMKRLPCFLRICLIWLFTGNDCFAQSTLTDSSFYTKAAANIHSQYMKEMGASSYLFTGTAYIRYWKGISGHPFFMTDQFQKGTVFYNGTDYQNVPLKYDMYKDLLVSQNFTGETEIALVNEKIASFCMGAHCFVRIVHDSSNAMFPNTGFYEKLYSGGTTVWVKRQNLVKQSLNAEDNITKFTEYNNYYVEMAGKYYPIEGEKELLSLFKDKKTEIRKFLNRRDISYKKDPAKTIVQTVAFYEQLIK
jgi:hypothetical protein